MKLAELVYPEGHRSPTYSPTVRRRTRTSRNSPGSHWSRSIVWARERLSISARPSAARSQAARTHGSSGWWHVALRSLPLHSPSRCRRPRGFNWCSDGSRECPLCRWSIITGPRDGYGRPFHAAGWAREVDDSNAKRPGSVKLVGGNGLDWKYREAAIDANIQSVGHHALLIIT